MIVLLVMYCCVTDYLQIKWLKLQTFIISVSVGKDSWRCIAAWVWFKVLHEISVKIFTWAVVSSEGSTWGESIYKLIHMVLTGLNSSLAVGQGLQFHTMWTFP